MSFGFNKNYYPGICLNWSEYFKFKKINANLTYKFINLNDTYSDKYHLFYFVLIDAKLPRNIRVTLNSMVASLTDYYIIQQGNTINR